MPHVTLRQLQSLISLKRTGKISVSAQELGLTGPAITVQLKQMEEQLGILLFDRSREGMRPTVAGEAALRAARDIEIRLRGLFDEIDTIRDAQSGRIAIGAGAGMRHADFIEALPGFLLPDRASQARLPLLVERLKMLTESR